MKQDDIGHPPYGGDMYHGPLQLLGIGNSSNGLLEFVEFQLRSSDSNEEYNFRKQLITFL